jgi:hypothetical protein
LFLSDRLQIIRRAGTAEVIFDHDAESAADHSVPRFPRSVLSDSTPGKLHAARSNAPRIQKTRTFGAPVFRQFAEVSKSVFVGPGANDLNRKSTAAN